MAKPETIDRFEIIASVTKDQLGHVMAALMTVGLPPEAIQSRMVTDVLNWKAKAQHDTSGIDFARAFIAEHPTFTRAEVIKHFRDHGRTDTACTGALWRLREEGVIRKLDAGNFQRADVKAIAAPKVKAAKVKAHAKGVNQKTGKPNLRKPPTTREHYATPNFEFLLAKLRTRKSMTGKELEDYFEADGRKKKSVGALLTNLIAMQKVRRLEPGVYAVAKVKKVKLTPRANLNGTGHQAPTAEVVTNG